MLDISIAAILCLVISGMAYWGVHVTLHPPRSNHEIKRYKVIFIVLALFAVGLTVWQGIRGNEAKKRIEGFIIHLDSLENEKVRTELSRREHRKEIRKQIGKLLDEGNAFKQACVTEKERLDLVPLSKAWAEKAINYLSSIDSSYSSRFNGATGLTYSVGPRINNEIYNSINWKSQVLMKILEELHD